MVIHVVKPGDTLYSLSLEYGVAMSLIAIDNGLEAPHQLVPGQALVIRFPLVVHTVRPGETLAAIAREYGVSLRQLYQNNLALEGRPDLWPGQTLVISYQQESGPEIGVNAYAYSNISADLLSTTLPFLTFLTPFTYGFTPSGALVPLDDARLLAAARIHGVAPLMHLSTLTPEGGFSNELAHLLLHNTQLQDILTDNILANLQEKGYRGLDVDFEYVFPEDAAAYAAFLASLTRRLNPLGYSVVAALAPKTSSSQTGALYEGHDFASIGAAVNEVLLMTYEWGYTYGPPPWRWPLCPMCGRWWNTLSPRSPPARSGLGSPIMAMTGPFPLCKDKPGLPPSPASRLWPWPGGMKGRSNMMSAPSPLGSATWMKMGASTRSGLRTPEASRPSWPLSRNMG